MFRVFESNKRCADYNFPNWDVDTFDTLEEAEIFAVLWCYPFSRKDAESYVKNLNIEIGKEFILLGAVIMKIEEIS